MALSCGCGSDPFNETSHNAGAPMHCVVEIEPSRRHQRYSAQLCKMGLHRFHLDVNIYACCARRLIKDSALKCSESMASAASPMRTPLAAPRLRLRILLPAPFATGPPLAPRLRNYTVWRRDEKRRIVLGAVPWQAPDLAKRCSDDH